MAEHEQSTLPGFEEFFSNEEDDIYEGAAPAGYFDAALLPDAPTYQKNAKGVQVYTLYVLFPSQEELKEAVLLLTGSTRKQGFSAGVTTATVPSTKKVGSKTLMEFWRECLGGKAL